MKKAIFSLCFVFGCFALANAQSAIVPVGGNASSQTGSVSYTVGQPAIQTVSDGTYSVSEGVQQPYEIQTVGVDEYPTITMNALVYPNPTADRITLEIPDETLMQFSSLKVGVFNSNGQLIATHQVQGTHSEFDLSSLAAATYYLRVIDGKKTVKTFKVVKTMR